MDVRELKDNAADYFRKGKFAKAAEAYLQLTKVEPKEGQHLIKLGDSYRRDGRKDSAIDAYRRAATDYAKQGIVIKAIAACKLILEIDPNEKQAQEALANLCAKRYVRREQTDTPPAQPAVRGARYTEPIELPDEDGGEAEPELETAAGTLARPAPAKKVEAPPARPAAPPPAKAEPPRPPPRQERPRVEPPRPPPPRVEPVRPFVAEAIELDLGLEAPARTTLPPTATPAPPTFARGEVPEPGAIELDLGLSESAPASGPAPADRRRGQATFDLSSEADELDVLAPEAIDEELPPGITLITAESTDEHEVLKRAEDAARAEPTAMAEILSESLLVGSDGGDGDEEELLSVTMGEPEPARAAAAEEELDFVPEPAAPKQAPQADAARATEEHAELMRLANEAAFDLTPPPEAELEHAEEEPPTPRPPPPPPGDVEQSQVPLFSELPREAFLDVLEQLTFRRVDAGEVILREGDAGKSIYVLASGKAKVVKNHGAPGALELAELDDGAFFGEMALLNGAPRVASVVATEDSEVLELTEALLRELTARHPSVGQSLKKFYRQRLLSNVMAISPLFRAFDKQDRRMLVEKFKLREAKADEVIIREGEKPDGLYVIMHGAALVTKKDPASARVMPLAVLKEGDVFGEMSLLSRKPASANVVAKRRTLVLRLPKAVFDELMFTHPAVLEVVSELTDQRSRVNEQILAGRAEAPREALALL